MIAASVLRAVTPWSASETVRVAGLTAIGGGATLVAWGLSSHEAALADQVRWANLSVAGFIVVAYGLVSWLLRGHWAVRRRRVGLLSDERVGGSTTDVAHADSVAAGPGSRRFHRADCALALGRPWPTIAREVAVADARLPCGICRP